MPEAIKEAVEYAWTADESAGAFKLAQALLDDPDFEHGFIAQLEGPFAGKCICGNEEADHA